MISRGHSLNDLLDGYPVDLLRNMHLAAQENRRRTVTEATLGFSVAVCHALDLAFSGGKGKVLETWMHSMEDLRQEKNESSQPRKRVMTHKAMQWFQNLPVSKKGPDR